MTPRLLAAVHRNWEHWRLGLLVWAFAFLALELPAHFDWVPWPTLSRTMWDAESAWHATTYFVEVFFAVLLAHIVLRLSVAALVAVVVCAAVTVAVHFLFGTP